MKSKSINYMNSRIVLQHKLLYEDCEIVCFLSVHAIADFGSFFILDIFQVNYSSQPFIKLILN